MTDRHAGYLVTLAEDVREDDAAPILAALSMVRGVASVQPVVGDVPTLLAQARRDGVWTEALVDLLDRIRKGQS